MPPNILAKLTALTARARAAAGNLPRPSLFVKLTALALSAAIATIGVFALSGKLLFQDAHDRHAHRIGSMTRLAVASILRNPTPQTLEKISEELDIDIRYADAHSEYTTSSAMPAFTELTPKRRHRHPRSHRRWRLPREFKLARAGENTYLLYNNGSQRAIVSLEHNDDDDILHLTLTLATITALLLIWGGVYLYIRHHLAPLTALRQDMAAVGAGEWRQCQTTRNDEIGMLARGFNDMQQRLRALLAARERFLIAASHELRSPIARLKLAAAMLENETTKTPISADIAELEHLTSDLLQNARLQSAHPGLQKTPITAGALINQLTTARPAADQTRITTTIDPTAASTTLHIDTPLITRALNNLIDNALKYADHATITLRHHAGGAPHNISISVTDNGAGVSDKDLPHLFEPFYRADESRTRASGGFGLGLAIAAAAIRAHNGTITATNHPPQGLQVTITL